MQAFSEGRQYFESCCLEFARQKFNEAVRVLIGDSSDLYPAGHLSVAYIVDASEKKRKRLRSARKGSSASSTFASISPVTLVPPDGHCSACSAERVEVESDGLLINSLSCLACVHQTLGDSMSAALLLEAKSKLQQVMLFSHPAVLAFKLYHDFPRSIGTPHTFLSYRLH